MTLPEIQKRGYKKILLVTSNYHTRRAGEIFRRQAHGSVAIVVVAAPDEFYVPDTWWHHRQAQKIFLNEWEKTVAAWLGM